MRNIKQNLLKNIELSAYYFIIFTIILNAILHNDNIIALISAICGISYTFFAGKGKPFCYIFGITGSLFYCTLSFQNSLWGNLLLYALYYLPMQFIGYYQWNKNLKQDKNEIIKIKLANQELIKLIIILSIISIGVYYILVFIKDSHPILDSITTVFSLGGMYLTVKRAIEQWAFWIGVNLLSLIMWIFVAINGSRVYSTIAMWGVYLFLAIYFYITWNKELKNSSK